MAAQGGNFVELRFLAGKSLVARTMVREVEIMDSTIKEHEKLTLRRRNLAIRTLVFTFYQTSQSKYSKAVRDDLTRSFACSFSVFFSVSSRICSSWKVGLKISFGAAPGVFSALFRGGLMSGDAGASPLGRWLLSSSMSTDMCFSSNPRSEGCSWGA